MENQEFQRHILARMQKMERKTMGGSYEENYTDPRKQSENITHENTPNHFIGDQTRITALQRIISFTQNNDADSVANFYGEEKIEYEKEKAICKMLVQKYNIKAEEIDNGFK